MRGRPSVKISLDRILPHVSPLLKGALRSMQAQREAQFASVPQTPARVVFLGDSITEWTAWEDWLPELATTNRGIGGEAVCDIQARLGTAIVAPTAISLLIGTNELHGLGRSREIDSIAEQMRALVQTIRQLAPHAPLFINSVVPRSPHFRARIVRLNDHYRRIAEQCGSTYVDLWSVLAGADGAIRPELSVDGLHLSIEGYRTWVSVLRPHLVPGLAARVN